MQTSVVGLAYGVPFGLPRAFLPSINPARSSHARWSKIPSVIVGVLRSFVCFCVIQFSVSEVKICFVLYSISKVKV